MNETPKCPYCGAEMGLKVREEPKKKWSARFVCGKCQSAGPFAHECQEKSYAEEVALAYTLRRAEPENRPMTLEEVRAHCAKGPDAEPLWVEFREKCTISRWIFAAIAPDVFDRPVLSEWIATGRSKEYGKVWRCWPRKPTPEQMAAEKWED